MEELKTILLDVISNLQLVLEGISSGEPNTEAATSLENSIVKMNDFIAKAGDGEGAKTNDDDDDEAAKAAKEKAADEEAEKAEKAKGGAKVQKGFEQLNALTSLLSNVQKTAEQANSDKVNKSIVAIGEKVGMLEKSFSKLLEGFGVDVAETTQSITPVEKGSAATIDGNQALLLLKGLSDMASQSGDNDAPAGSLMGQGIIRKGDGAKGITKNAQQFSENFAKLFPGVNQ